MNFGYKLRNHKLRYKEKFSNLYYKQLLRLGKMFISYPRLSIRHGILKVIVGLTYRCQCKCRYCCSGAYPQLQEDELKTDEIKHILDQISVLPSLFTVASFFGGEALLREDVYQLIEYATNKGLFTEVETNGILLNRENVNKLKKVGLHHIFIRIESSRFEVHDRLSNFKGCFEKATEGIKNCVREKLSCTISTIALREKIHNNELEKIIDLGKKFGITSIRILYPTLSGNWLNEKHQLLNEDEKAKVKELLEPAFVYLESTYSAKKEIGRICPSVQKKSFYISPHGKIQLCPFVPLVFGNVRSEKLYNILRRMWQQPFFNNVSYNGCLMNDVIFRNRYLE